MSKIKKFAIKSFKGETYKGNVIIVKILKNMYLEKKLMRICKIFECNKYSNGNTLNYRLLYLCYI